MDEENEVIEIPQTPDLNDGDVFEYYMFML
jgi:hypothetical protein